ncbi:MAG: hypothetical protein ACM3VT_14380 [Solirubrobacterales bacterium]
MARSLASVAIVAMLSLAGCARSESPRASLLDGAQSSSADVSIQQRLEDEHLPALKSVEPWGNEFSSGLKLTTDHYEIYTTVQQPLMLRRIPGFVESAFRGYNDQLAQPVETSYKFTVYLFADRRQWEDFTNAFAGDQAPVFCKIQTGAYYLNGACVVYDIGAVRTLAALGHEGWHQFNSRLFKYRLPSWLDEGVAMLFEASIYEQGLFRFDPSQNVQRLGGLKRTLAGSKLIPLRELIATSPGEALASDQTETVMAFYSQSYALVRFLHESRYGTRLTAYRRLMQDGLQGSWPLDASAAEIAENRNIPRTIPWNRMVGRLLFERYVDADVERLDAEYQAFCRRLVSGLTFIEVEEEDRFAAR